MVIILHTIFIKLSLKIHSQSDISGGQICRDSSVAPFYGKDSNSSSAYTF